jgi:KEOPS complex subunit Cgi121
MTGIEVIGARGPVDVPDQLYQRLNGMNGMVVALDPGMVCGREHLLSAAQHARRAFERGTNSSSNLGIETILYASGERQISRALDKMGIAEGATGIALVIYDASPDEVLDALGMERDDNLLDCALEKLLAFGIKEEEMDSLPEELRGDLILERVAFVEVLKR